MYFSTVNVCAFSFVFTVIVLHGVWTVSVLNRVVDLNFLVLLLGLSVFINAS